MNKICDNCETVAHCMKNGCVPKQPVISAGPITPEMLHPWTQQERDELTAVLKKHFVIKPKKGSYEAVFGHLGMTPDELGNYIIELQEKAAQPAPCTPEQLLAFAQTANLGLDKVIKVFQTAAITQEPEAMTFEEAYESLSWQEWRMRPIKELLAELHRLTTPPRAQRPWTGLTDEQRRDVPIPDYMKVSTAPSYEFANGWNACVATIKSKLKEQNT